MQPHSIHHRGHRATGIGGSGGIMRGPLRGRLIFMAAAGTVMAQHMHIVAQADQLAGQPAGKIFRATTRRIKMFNDQRDFQ